MKTHTSEFKNKLKVHGRELDSIITYQLGNQTITLGNEQIISVTPHYEGAILKSIMKQLDIVVDNDIPLNTIINYQFGIKVRDEEVQNYRDNYDYVNFGNYVVYSSEKQEDTKKYKIICYDKLLYSMKDYEKMNIMYPISIRDYINAICQHLGLTFKNASGTFANYNKEIQSELYLTYDEDNEEWKSLDYTFRDVLDEIAQATASTICINEEDDQLEVRYITDSGDTIDEEYLKNIKVSFGEQFGPINTIVLSRSGGSDKVYLSYPPDLPDDQKNAIEISDNQIMNWNDRSTYLSDILNRLNGLTYYLNDFSSPGIVYYNLCDRYSVQIDNQTYSCVMFNDQINITQGLSEDVYTDRPPENETDYTKADKTDRRINQTYLIVDKQNQQIASVINTVDDQNDKISQITQTVDEINSKISDIADITISGESNYATFDLDDINTSEPIMVKVHPTSENISTLHPSSVIYPSSTAYLKPRKIRFHNKTTNEDVDYELPDDLLRYNSEIYDEFYLDYDSQTCQITKKCKYNADGTVGLLTTPVTTDYEYPLIELEDGDYTISIFGYDNGYIFARLMTKNIYTTQFYTKAETDSLIDQTASNITLSVDQTLTRYSTTDEMNAAINLKANEITSTVSDTYATKTTTNQLSSRITQNADSITSEVTRATTAEGNLSSRITTNANSITSEVSRASGAEGSLSSRISQTAKSISLNVNNGSTSSGITITTTKEDGTTSQATGTIQMNGLVKFTDLSTSGSTTINGSNITTGTIDASQVTVNNINASKITSGTLSANRISGGTISASTLNLGSGKFKVTTAGALTSTSGTIGGWTITSKEFYGTDAGGSERYGLYTGGLDNMTSGICLPWSTIFWSYSSDRRIKENIKDIEDKYEKFYNSLKPKTFNYINKPNSNEKHIGFIAQDILESEKLVNEDLALIKENDDNFFLDKTEIIGLNTWQIQKMKEEIKLLKKEINSMKEEINNLKKESDK